jgi:hypothetical protein
MTRTIESLIWILLKWLLCPGHEFERRPPTFFPAQMRQSIPPPWHLDNVDAFLLAILTSTAFAVRFWCLFHPSGVVFDEVYFGNFANYSARSEFYHY